MKITFTGGVKSGKSVLAERKALELSPNNKPYYLATSIVYDEEFQKRIDDHKKRREDKFVTIEEPYDLNQKIKTLDNIVLVECMTLWLFNMISADKSEKEIFYHIEETLSLDQNIIFVINEIGLGVIAEKKEVRQFVDLSGKISQILGQRCDEVYFCSCGLSMKLK